MSKDRHRAEVVPVAATAVFMKYIERPQQEPKLSNSRVRQTLYFVGHVEALVEQGDVCWILKIACFSKKHVKTCGSL